MRLSLLKLYGKPQALAISFNMSVFPYTNTINETFLLFHSWSGFIHLFVRRKVRKDKELGRQIDYFILISFYVHQPSRILLKIVGAVY